MDANELLKKIRKIEIKSRILSQNIFAGQYHSTFKGRGMMFSEVREYQYGDDVRDIDWNVTARHNKPYVKVYEEERELTVMLLIDISGSTLFGAVGPHKRDIIAEIAATLAFSATQNNDKVGAIFFTDKIEYFIPPKKGRHHILLILRQLLTFEPQNQGTDIAMALRYFTDALKRRTTAFLISDFIAPVDYKKELSMARNKHDLMALQVYDQRDATMPRAGLLHLTDLETGTLQWVDTNSRRVRQAYDKWWYTLRQQMTDVLKATHVQHASISTDEDYVKALMGLFRTRPQH